MKKKNLIKHVFCMLLVAVTFSSCENEDQYEGLILTDTNTGKVYLMKHNFVDTYFIDEKVVKISGNDTTYVFE